MSPVGKLIDAASDNLRTLLLVCGGYVALVQMGYANYPDLPALPSWASLAGMGIVGALAAGYFAGGKIWALLPDPPRVYLLAVRAEDPERVEVWQLTPDQFEAMEVRDGTLNHLSEAKHPAYECLSYDPEENVATATWRETVASSELMGHSEVTDALDQIAELRETFEKEARIGMMIRRRIGSIVRVLDRRRAEDQARALEGHTAPSLDGESVDDVLQEVLGDLRPEHMAAEEQADADGTDGDGATDQDGPPDVEQLAEVVSNGHGGGPE